jgi:hypothetical protein
MGIDASGRSSVGETSPVVKVAGVYQEQVDVAGLRDRMRLALRIFEGRGN